MSNALFIDVATNEIIERKLTPEEIESQKSGVEDYQALSAEIERLKTEKESAKITALEKLKKLGLTEAEALAIIGL